MTLMMPPGPINVMLDMILPAAFTVSGSAELVDPVVSLRILRDANSGPSRDH